VSQAIADPADAGPDAPLDPRRWTALVVIAIAQLMVILDATIVNVAIPKAAEAIGIGPNDTQWMVTAYALPFGALLLLGGRIADFLGRKRILMIALSGFAIASALGGAAQDPAMIYAARALQGVFAAMMAPAALSLLTVTFQEPKERARAFAVFGAIAGGGAALGLVLGGVLTEYVDWRWCFFVNIPIAIIAVALAIPILRESKISTTTHYDIPGAVLGTLGLGALVWGFTRPTSVDAATGQMIGWGSFETIAWLVGAVVLLALFVMVERRSSSPLLPMRVLTNRNRAGAYIVGSLVGAGMFAVFLFLTLYMQLFLHYEPLQAGLGFLPFSGGVIIGAGIGSQLVLKIGAKFVVPIGLVMGAAALAWLSRLDVDTTYVGTILPAEIVMAVGMGFIFMSVTNVALVGISKDDAGVASAMVNTTQQIGGSLGTALLTTFSTSAAATYLALHLPAAGSGEQGQALAQGAAAVHGWGVAFLWASAFFVLAAIASVLLINAGRLETAPAEGAPVHVG
jgi:EmrB/QacA subfamily drug resistance transporter